MLATCLAGQPASAETIKVGVIGPLSGSHALAGKNFKAGIDAYFAINGNKVGSDAIEIVYRDLPEADPAKSKALGQQLIMLVFGGTGTLYGALIGTAVFQNFEHYVSAANPFHWMTLVGLMLIAVVLFAPTGLQGLGKSLARLASRRSVPKTSEAGHDRIHRCFTSARRACEAKAPVPGAL